MRKWVVVPLTAAVLVGACGRDVQPEATAGPTSWDPCSITPEAIAATGLDPTYRDEGWGEGIIVEDWEICTFKPLGVSVPYFLAVKSSVTQTFADVRRDSLEFEPRDVALGGRDAFTYRRVMGRSAVACNIAVDLPPGVVVFTVNYVKEDESDPCAIALTHATDLQSALPVAVK
ncbi:DUF3558 family protein [Rhodococcoides kyotonense]|uniref:DUF3558 domain-containing protein n=1 Tax=Rhodococcoides kyotonense TaxID=398843 RepID=A0A239IQE7_9NOCA|nr:DUF3558 family protein [Rhodococcus kyotonensis]SNS94654.1 Protein of unknown function [Rhodococcus kyotonensis]